MIEKDYQNFIDQLRTELKAECAISNKYGIVLASNIDYFLTGKTIPQNMLELMVERQNIEKEIKNERLTSFILETQNFNYVFTFHENYILISKLPLNVNIAEFASKAYKHLKEINEKTKELDTNIFSTFDFSKDIAKIKIISENEKFKPQRYKIIKDLIKFVSK